MPHEYTREMLPSFQEGSKQLIIVSMLAEYFLVMYHAVKLLTEDLPGIHQCFIPKKRLLC
jgi:hypothetical protein